MSLSTVLTYQPGEKDDPYAFVTMNHMYFQVYLEDKLLYSYLPGDTDNISNLQVIPMQWSICRKTVQVKHSGWISG